MQEQLIGADIQTKKTEQSIIVNGLQAQDSDETFEYELSFEPMRLTQKVNGILSATVFEADSLYFEKSTGYNKDSCLSDDPISFIQRHTIQWSGYQVDIDY